ncbi:MAG: hypothetical protein R2738_09840 [Bacteroides graminisolvens]
MEQNNKRMHEATDPELYFVIDEKLNSVDLTDKGIDLITGNSEDHTLFVLPDIASELSALEAETGLTEEQKLEKRCIDDKLCHQVERVHTNLRYSKHTPCSRKMMNMLLLTDRVKVVDEASGRIMEGRRYSDGLHQAIEAKETCESGSCYANILTITLQNYFRMYHKLSGMAGYC